jgi:hypothetical protein
MEYEANRDYRNHESEPTRTPRGSYSSPRFRSLSPADARELLLRHSDPNDAEIKFMLECIERLKGSVDG